MERAETRTSAKPSPDVADPSVGDGNVEVVLDESRAYASFFGWLIASGPGGGLRRWLNRWLLVHILVGGLISFFFHNDLAERARSAVLPMAGVLVGLTFA